MDLPIPYGRQHITEEDIAAVVAALKSDYMTQGLASGSLNALLQLISGVNMRWQ